jgi:hypothetical protein
MKMGVHVQTDIQDVVDNQKVEVRSSSISGKGTFARKKIARGEFILTLTGKPVIPSKLSSAGPEFGVTVDDPLQIGDELLLILDYASKTINHSCDPNTGMRNQTDLFALRDIKVDEEITYDYSTTSGINDTWTMPCCCKTQQCRKQIGNVLTLPRETLHRYLNSQALPNYLIRQLENVGWK